MNDADLPLVYDTGSGTVMPMAYHHTLGIRKHLRSIAKVVEAKVEQLDTGENGIGEICGLLGEIQDLLVRLVSMGSPFFGVHDEQIYKQIPRSESQRIVDHGLISVAPSGQNIVYRGRLMTPDAPIHVMQLHEQYRRLLGTN